MRMVLFCLGFSVFAYVIVGVADAYGQSRKAHVSEWADMGEADGVRVYRFSDGNKTCYVSTPGGGLSCL